MKSRLAATYVVLGGCLAAVVGWRVLPVEGASPKMPGLPIHSEAAGWNSAMAAHALDARETWWQQWPHAQKDHGTVCVSCHTVLPYAMVRPQLQRQLGEAVMPAQEAAMMKSVEKRVAQWPEMVPFYSDAHDGVGKTAESHATEAVLNAVILTSFDTQEGHLRPITRTALDEVWALQEQSGERAGGWKWQDFHLAPWESTESAYQGAALLMLKVMGAPDGYAGEPGVRGHVARLQDYLERQYASQPVMNQLYILWASSKAPSLLSPDARAGLIAKVRSLQQPDGGWRTMALDSIERSDHSPEPEGSDGFATALVVLTFDEAGVGDPAAAGGAKWLRDHQNPDGSWDARSMNKQRDPASVAGPFMSDAATGYAAMALLQVQSSHAGETNAAR